MLAARLRDTARLASAAWRRSLSGSALEAVLASAGAPPPAGLTDESVEFAAAASAFGQGELMPHAHAWDARKAFPREVLSAAAELGFASLYIGDDVGGAGLGRADGAGVFEALAYSDISVASYLTIHNMNAYVIDTFGTEAQRKRWLPRLATAELLSSYCLTEPSSGSDAASLQTSARRDGTDYVLNGSKAFISGGGLADVYVVMARTGGPGPKGVSCFVVEKGTPGLSFGKPEEKMGWCAQPTCAVTFDDVRVPEENRIGEEGVGFTIAMKALDGGRINIATCSVGGAQYCLDKTMEYTSGRSQFGQPVSHFQNTQFKLADMATATQASRLMVRSAANALDAASPSATIDAAMAKRFATDTAYGVANDALQLHGGYGFIKEYHIERYVRDLRVHTILEGTNEVMRMIISRKLGVS